jgi:hypothetical protein
MINKIPKNFKKKVYHILTSGNADIAFYTEAFVTGNKEWVMKKPISFALNLIKININCRIPRRKYTIKGLVPGKKCMARIHRRPKVYQYAMAIMRYPCIFTDVFGSLLEFTLDYDEIYKRIENEYRLPGFYKLRKKKDNYYKTITSIYDEISNELNAIVSKDIEINMVKNHVVVNPYLKKAFEIASYNHTKIIAIIETSYSEGDIKEILGEEADFLCDIRVSSERKLSFKRMRNEYMKNHQNTATKAIEEEFAVISSNYNTAIKNARKYGNIPLYYRSSKEIMKSIPAPNLTSRFKEIYQTIAGVELFSGQYNHKNIYETTYLYIAPAIYALLEKTYQKAETCGGKVIALCDPECVFVTLYEKYFGDMSACIWSGVAGATPSTKEEWNDLMDDCNLIGSYPADRIAHSLGFPFHQQLLKNCREDFIDEAVKKARVKDEEAIKNYIKNYLGNEKRILVVDPMPGFASFDFFRKYGREVNPQIEIEEVSMSRYLNRNSKELHILHLILQMDIPYIMGFYGKDEITFTQPRFIDEVKKKTINGAIEDYCKAFVSYQRKNNDINIHASDINEILEYSKEGLVQLEEVLGGGIE